MLSNAMAESLGKAIFHNTITASLPMADLNFTAGSVTSIALALHTAYPGIGGSQTTSEASYTSYARQTLSRTSGNWPFTSPNIFENGATITFPTNTGSAQVVSWLSLGSNTGNRILFSIPLALETPRPFSLLVDANDTVQCDAHGYSAGQEIMFLDTEGAGLPTGITEGTVYYVRTAPNTNDFKIGTVAGGGGSDLAIAAVGGGVSSGGLVCKVSSKSIGTNDNLVFDTTNKITVILR